MKSRKLQTNTKALLTSAAAGEISVLQNQKPSGKLQKIKNES